MSATKESLSLRENPHGDRSCGEDPKGVLKQVGSTSTSFIGPACRPGGRTKTQPPHQVDHIEQSLSDFYHELESLESSSPDSAAAPRPPADTHALHPDTRTLHPPLNTTPGTDLKRSSQPHWGDPYHHHHDPKRPRPSGDDDSWRSHRRPQNRPPFWCYPRHPPRFPPPPPPPGYSGPFPGPPLPPGHFVPPRRINPNWTPTYPYPQDSHVPPDQFSPPPSNMCRDPQPPGCSGPSPPPCPAGDRFLPPCMCRDPQPPGCGGPSPPPHPAGYGWGGCSADPWSSNPGVNRFSGDPDAWKWGRDPARPQGSAPEMKPVDVQREEDCTTQAPDSTPSSSSPTSSSSSSSSSLSLILMRGLPGSGKSTTARELVCTGPSGVILSTDDYFAHQDGYLYEPSQLSDAHHWNQNRADKAMLEGRSPLIIDNTNLQAWEMKPYVTMALERGYRIYFQEPNTQWKFDPVELEKRNKHGVQQQKISQMLERFSFPISVETVMTSQEPKHASARMKQRRRH